MQTFLSIHSNFMCDLCECLNTNYIVIVNDKIAQRLRKHCALAVVRRERKI